MSKFDKETTIGGLQGSFQPTQWTQIKNAKTTDFKRKQVSLNNLLNRYWKPVFCYLRYKRYDIEKAKDLTQGFFHEIVIGRELIQQADQQKGRFRTFLLKALDCYLASIYRKETAKKRHPIHGTSSLDILDPPDMPIEELKDDPDQVFNYCWATNILDFVLKQVKEDYCDTDRTVFWKLFQDRILKPIFDNTEAPSLTELCKRYGIENERKASNMIITVKRRFSTALRYHLRQYVQNESEIEEEFYELIKIISKDSAVS